ncbi:MAG: hypothetical protein ACQEW8_02020 [Actinomycetota bacterium]
MKDATRPSTTTWFATVTRPARRLLTTLVVLIIFAFGIGLGTVYSDHRFWFHGPAIVVLLGWYVVMMRVYRRSRRTTR